MSVEGCAFGAGVYAGEASGHAGLEQTDVGNIHQVFGDEPTWFFRGHPIARVEARQIDRLGISAHGALAAQVEIIFEITHRQLAQAAIDGLAVAAAGIIRLGKRAPVTVNLKTATTWSVSFTASKSMTSGGNPITRKAAAAKIAPSRQWQVRSRSTSRGDQAVPARWYSIPSMNFWIPAGVRSARKVRRSPAVIPEAGNLRRLRK